MIFIKIVSCGVRLIRYLMSRVVSESLGQKIENVLEKFNF